MIDLSGLRADIDGALANGTACLVATASARGEPNVSLRGSMMVFDDQHLAYWDRTRARQLEHVSQNPNVVVFYRDSARRVAYRIYGQATVHRDGAVREQVMARTVESLCVFIGSMPALAQASMYLAEVPNRVNRSASAKSNSTLPEG